MKDKVGSLMSAFLAALSMAPTWTTAGILALLGLAGGAASTIAGWLAPVLIVLSLALLARAFYVLYVQKRGNATSKVITWLSAIFIAGFWTWQLL